MAPGWEMGMEFGMEFEGPVSASSAPSTITAASPAYMYGIPSVDTLRIDDLLDFSNVEHFPSSAAGGADTHLVAPPPDPSPAASRSRSFIADESSDGLHHPHLSTTTTTFSDNLYIPCEEAAELEWLSQFVEDSFSNVPYPSATESHIVTPSADAHLQTDPTSVPGRGARSKRSRASTPNSAHHLVTTWSSLAPPPTHSSSSSTTSSSSSSSSDFPTQKPSSSTNSNSRKKGGGGEVGGGIGVEGGVRRCTHCASEKTPQWRTGPLGPKTLCNACGVRFKSGRLMPEYRPAASPTFVLTQHSNSHRKVMELRRQKDMVVLRHDGHPTSSSAAAAARPDILFHDYEVC